MWLHPKKLRQILRLDIDNFREINEKLGMDYGDIVLRETAKCIESILSDKQFIYHITADEFAILDLESKTENDAHQLYRRIRKVIDRYVSDNGYVAFFTISRTKYTPLFPSAEIARQFILHIGYVF